MHKRIDSFPFFEPPEDETNEEIRERHVEMLHDCHRLTQEYGSNGGADIDQLVQHEHYREDAYGTAMGLAEDFWRAWKNHGLASRGELPDLVLKLALAWCSIVAQRAFVAGVQRGRTEANLDRLLKQVSLDAEERDHDMG